MLKVDPNPIRYPNKMELVHMKRQQGCAYTEESPV